MNLTAFGALLVMNILGAIAPGPDIVLVTRYATRSRKHAIMAATGIQLGVLFWCTLTVMGAAALLTAFPGILQAIQAIGGTFLIFMGVRSIRGGLELRRNPPADMEEAATRLGSLRQAFRTGLATNLSNPKIVLFLAAMIAPLLPAHPPLWLSVVLILSMSLSAYAVFLVLCTVISTPAIRRRMLAAGPWIDIAAGTFFAVAGCALITVSAAAALP
ncbi:LysE family translocator [Corynebacterium sp.]|uniref:LysE family translocator n=1 Tax=Corynebacterium sp. TaxID=1720 RepID=UPI0026DCC477|nr:LysE family translocator [Corynebacterium sp.]MDO5031072.1 LysE family translocator [Corynebacterium sp.]